MAVLDAYAKPQFPKKLLLMATVGESLRAPQIRAADRPGRGEEEDQMTLIPNTSAPTEGQSPWLGFVKFLLLAILVGLIFLLAHAMVNHRFFRGGWVDQRDVLNP
jgi:hypothetical protein